jgi:hypothetical protein
VAPAGAKATSIRAAADATAAMLGFAAEDVVPVAVPPDGVPYNIDALWARIAKEIDEAKLVQLDRLRVGHQRLGLREVGRQIENAGRFLVKGVLGSASPTAPQ